MYCPQHDNQEKQLTVHLKYVFLLPNQFTEVKTLHISKDIKPISA